MTAFEYEILINFILIKLCLVVDGGGLDILVISIAHQHPSTQYHRPMH